MAGFWNRIAKGAVLGLASGILSTAGPTVVLLTTPQAALPHWARTRWVRRFAVASAVGELLANAAISSLPPRTSRDPLTGRIVMGALSGALATRGEGSTGLVGAMAGAAAVPVSAWIATNGRAAIVPPVPDIVVAGFETACAYGLARSATRR